MSIFSSKLTQRYLIATALYAIAGWISGFYFGHATRSLDPDSMWRVIAFFSFGFVCSFLIRVFVSEIVSTPIFLSIFWVILYTLWGTFSFPLLSSMPMTHWCFALILISEVPIGKWHENKAEKPTYTHSRKFLRVNEFVEIFFALQIFYGAAIIITALISLFTHTFPYLTVAYVLGAILVILNAIVAGGKAEQSHHHTIASVLGLLLSSSLSVWLLLVDPVGLLWGLGFGAIMFVTFNVFQFISRRA